MNRKAFLRAGLIVCAIAATVYWGRHIFDLDTFGEFRARFNLAGFLPVAFFSILASYFVRTLRFLVLLRRDIPLYPCTFAELLVVLNFLFGFASLTPGQLGDVVKVEFVHNRFSVPRSTTFKIFVQEKILDLVCIIVLAVLAIRSEQLADVIGLNVWMIVIGAGGFVLLAAGCLYILKQRRIDLRALLDWRALPATLLLTALFWYLVIWGWQQIWAVHGITVGALATGFAVSGSTLISIVSFIPGAIGVSEVSVAGALILQGVDVESASIASLLTRCYMLAIIANGVLFAPGVIWVWWRTRKMQRTAKERCGTRQDGALR